MKSKQSSTNVNLANFGGEGERRDTTQTSLTVHEIKKWIFESHFKLTNLLYIY